MTLSPSFYKFCIAVLALGCVFLWFKSCHPSPPSPVVIKNNENHDSLTALSTLNKKRADTLKQLKDRDIYDNEVIEEVANLYQQADSVAGETKKQLRETQRQLALAKLHKDTAATLLNCDSLNQEATRWRLYSDESDKQAQDYVFKTSRELYHKDSLLDVGARQLKGLQQQADLCDTILAHAGVKRPPLLRGYFGGSVGVGAYNNIGPELHLLNRSDVMYNFRIKFGIGGVTYEAGIAKFITFKK